MLKNLLKSLMTCITYLGQCLSVPVTLGQFSQIGFDSQKLCYILSHNERRSPFCHQLYLHKPDAIMYQTVLDSHEHFWFLFSFLIFMKVCYLLSFLTHYNSVLLLTLYYISFLHWRTCRVLVE
jgi:hypothetical protein